MAHTANFSVNAQEGVFCAWLITLIFLPLRAPKLNRYGYYLWVIKNQNLHEHFTFFARTERQYLKRNYQYLRMSSVVCYKYFKRM